jgi:hypothetical protein
MEIMRGFLLFFAVALLAPRAFAFDQVAAQEESRRVHDQGSNDSLHASYGNALHAVNNFFSGNIPGAISKGVKAYGQYRNSNQLDDLRDKNQRLAGSMGSVGTEPVPAPAAGRSYVSPYARLDTKFLHEGPTAEIAAKLEKMSGMPRDEMFRMMVDVHTHSKSLADPDFVPWGIRTYKDLTAKMPDADFRARLESLGGLLEAGLRNGAVSGAVAQFRAIDRGAGPAMVADAASAKREPASEAPKAASAAPERAPVAVSRTDSPLEGPIGFTNRGSATTGVDGSKRGLDRLQFEPVDGELGSLFQRAGAPDDGTSLFHVVSVKLREVSARQKLEKIAGR